MTTRRTLPAGCVALLALALLGGCASRQTMTTPGEPSPKWAGTSYYEEGELLFLSVDVRAARIGGPRNLLPLYFVAVKHRGSDFLELGRESFVLEFPDKTLVPLASYEEYENDYGRGRADARVVELYLDTINGRFPRPPYSWLPLDFFPLRASGTFPRDKVAIRARDLVHGFLYFPLPEDPPLDRRYTLLLSPLDSEVTYVLDFPPYKED
jgi:hypothetical protein